MVANNPPFEVANPSPGKPSVWRPLSRSAYSAANRCSNASICGDKISVAEVDGQLKDKSCAAVGGGEEEKSITGLYDEVDGCVCSGCWAGDVVLSVLCPEGALDG